MLSGNKRDQLLGLSTTLAVDAMDRLGLPEAVLDPVIRPLAPNSRMVGTAITVLLQSQPELSRASLSLYSEALENRHQVYCPIIAVQVPPEHHHRGVFGEGAATAARKSGYVGALIEGAVRDTSELQRMDYPVFSRTVSPGYIVGKVEAVSIGESVEIGGIIVEPGGVIFGDNDGVVAIAADKLDEVLERAQAISDWEDEVHRWMEEGCSSEEAMARAGEMP